MRARLMMKGALVGAALLLVGATSVAAGNRDHPDGIAAAGLAALAPPLARQPTSETTYVPLAPCRIVDSRNGTGTNDTPLGSGTQRTYYVRGTVGFQPQGGLSGGCGVPAGATSVSAVVAAVRPSSGGHLKAWATGQPEPNATVLNYSTQTTSTGASLTLSESDSRPLTVRNFGVRTDLVIDVTGYYIKPIAGMIGSDGAPYAGSSRILGATRNALGVYTVQVDRNIHYCTATATVWDASYYASTDTYLGGAYDTVQVRLYNADGAAVDRYFYLTVTC